jgi:hypothetical protein
MNIDIERVRNQVQKNCDISDARHAGLYSLCGLLLRLRNFYKWEQALPPWQEPEPADLLEWVDARESWWEEIIESDFEAISIGEENFDPFDTEAINAKLRSSGLVYGAGYVAGMKPSFFLAERAESRRLGSLRVDVVNRELARDLFFTPAMKQGDQVFARHSAMLISLWDQIMEKRPSVEEHLAFALSQYGLDAEALRHSPQTEGPKLQCIAEKELDAWIYHEVGEAHEDAFDGYLWHEIVSTYANSPVEIFARVVKDLLADTHTEGLLGHIVRHRLKSSLAFYLFFMRSFSRLLFPEITCAFKQFRLNDDDWSAIESAREQGYAKAKQYAEELVQLHQTHFDRGAEWAKARIIEQLIEPLGFLSSTKPKEEPH